MNLVDKTCRFTKATPTRFSHCCDVHAQFKRHEAEDGEDGEAGDQAGGAVEQTQGEGVSVAVVVVFVVASQGWQAAQADGVGEKDLAAGVHPHLGDSPGQSRESEPELRPSLHLLQWQSAWHLPGRLSLSLTLQSLLIL